MLPKLGDKDAQKIKEIDSSVANKWRFEWLECTVSIRQGTNEDEVRIGDTFNKVSLAGQAECTLCSKVTNYGTRGLISLKEHMKSNKHIKLHFETKKCNKVNTMFKQYVGEPLPESSKSAPATVPMCDRISNAEASTLAVVVEHGMPLSYVPTIVSLAKALAKDPKALSEMKLDRTAATYKAKYGLAEGFKQKLVNRLKKCPFSMNLDEATSSNKKKVLTILVSYLDQDTKKVMVEHLDSLELRKTDSETIFQAIVNIMENNEIPWVNLVSVLMDSCGVMRGKKSGVETRIRNEKAPHLLDIDGDSCHHIHNSSKKLCEPFSRYLESMYNDMHADFQYCSEYAGFLSDICAVIGITYSKPARFIPHRWLSAYDQALQTTMLYDAYTIFYYSFLKGADKETYKEVVEKILEKKGVDEAGKKKIYAVQNRIAAKKMTDDGKGRKQRICEKVLMTDITTRLQLSFYCAVMQILKQYVCLFQSKDTMVHQLHEEQFSTFKHFLAGFLRAESVVSLTPKTAKTLTFADKDKMLSPRKFFIGAEAEQILKECAKDDPSVLKFLSQVKDAYIKCASQMQKTLPLNNKTLKSLAALSPELANDSQGSHLLKQLALEQFKHLLTEEEQSAVGREVLRYSVDNTIVNECIIVVDWWSKINARKCYPVLSKVAAAGLSIFHGPAVESTFNTLGDIVDSKAASMEIDTYSAYQTVRYALKSRDTTALEYFNRRQPDNSRIVDKHLCVNMRLAAQRYKKEQAKRREEKVRRQGKNQKTVTAVKADMANANKTDFDNHVQKEVARAKKRVITEKLTALAKKRKICDN